MGFFALAMTTAVSAQTNNTPWSTTGDIGIGTTSPNTKLHVVGSTRFENAGAVAASFRGEISLTNSNHVGTIKYGTGVSQGGAIELWGTDASLDPERTGQVNIISSTAPTQVSNTNGNNPSQGMTSDGLIRFMNSNGTTWQTNMTIYPSGKISIGNVDRWSKMYGDYKLYVTGGILTERVRVASYSSADWADYVFAPAYKLPSLAEMQRYTQQNRHLPNIPSAEDVEKHGYDLPSMDAKLLEKVEEAYLHLFEMDARMKALETELATLKNKQ